MPTPTLAEVLRDPSYGPQFAEAMREIHPSLPHGLAELDRLDPALAEAAVRRALHHACECQNMMNIMLGRAALVECPRDWLAGRLVGIADATLNLEDEWEARRLLEVGQLLGPAALVAIATRLRQSTNADVLEAVDDLTGT